MFLTVLKGSKSSARLLPRNWYRTLTFDPAGRLSASPSKHEFQSRHANTCAHARLSRTTEDSSTGKRPKMPTASPTCLLHSGPRTWRRCSVSSDAFHDRKSPIQQKGDEWKMHQILGFLAAVVATRNRDTGQNNHMPKREAVTTA